MVGEPSKVTSAVRSIDGKTELTFERTTEWNAPITITLGSEAIEVHSGPLAQAVRLINLEEEPT